MSQVQRGGATRRPLRILLTNNTLGHRTGSELFVYDLAVSLMKRGHLPVAYSPMLGEVAEALTRATVPVIDDLAKLADVPDIIHGQHHLETVTATLRFPLTPALFVCHGWLPWQEEPPVLPSISHYVAVDNLCRERLLTTPGIAPEQVSVIRNFVNLAQFLQRRDWRRKPASALVFSNYAYPDDARTETIRAACHRAGISRVDVVGLRAGNSQADPSVILPDYDVVFGKARCALEAMASGAAVVVTDYAGLAGMVTFDRVANLRDWNFGARTMQAADVTEDNVFAELQRYDADDVRRVSDYIREQADMTVAVDRWIATYERVIEASGHHAITDAAAFLASETTAASIYLQTLAPYIKARETAETTAQAASVARAEAERRLDAASRERDALQQRLSICERDKSVLSDEVAGLHGQLSTLNSALDIPLHRRIISRIMRRRT